MTKLPERRNAPTPQSEKPRRVPPKVRDAIDRYVSGRAKTITAAAEQAGLTREYLSRSLSLPHVSEFLRQKAARFVATSAGRAAARLSELIDADSEHVAFDASKHALAIAGIKPAHEANVNLNLNIQAGYVIDLSPPGATDDASMKIVSPRPEEETGPQHEHRKAGVLRPPYKD